VAGDGRPPELSIRARVWILVVVAFAAMLAAGAMAFLAQQSAARFVERTAASQRRAAVLFELQADASAYTEKMAAVLLLGRGELDALGAARIQMERALVELTRTTRDEISTLGDLGQVASKLPAVDDSRRMVELYHDIDGAANRALALQRAGQQDQANASFREDVEFRVLNELQPLFDSAAASETDGLTQAADAQKQAQQTFLAALALLSAIAAAILILLGLWLLRAARRTQVSAEAASLTGENVRLGAELDVARQRLAAVDKRSAQFLADVGHELRTPVTVLRGEADVALHGSNPDEQRQSLERIRGQAAELGQLLDDLIAYARSDSESQPDARADLRLDEVVGAAAQEGRMLAEPREVTVAMTLRDEGCHIEADFRRLKQALMIGLDNAIKHSAPGGEVGIETALTDGHAHINILDQGSGVAAEDQPRVFERFYRGKGEAGSLSEGLGIGLAIAKEIIERHGGSIALTNRSGGGAMLAMTLPLAGKPA